MSDYIKANMEQELDHKPTIAALSWRERFYSWLPTSKKALHKVMFRVGVLFSMLCVIKLVMLVGFRKHLFEIHWRVGDLPFSPFNKLAFYGFAALVGINLWRLGKQCASVSTKAARAANACILTLAGLFILLTFHEGDKNWLHPVLNGILKWKDLESYFALSLFFRPPFLAAWVLGYAFTYYFLVRLRREYLILQVTAVCGAAYIALCLRDLMIYRDALVIVNCIGWSCVMTSLGTRRPLGVTWIVSSFANIVLCFALFSGFSAMLQVSKWTPEFSILFLGSLIVFIGATAISLTRGFFNGWSWVLPFGLAAFLLFININYNGAHSYNNLLCLGFLLPHYFLNEFLIAVAVMTLAIGYVYWRPGGTIWWLDVLNLLIIIWTVLDLRFSQITGARLDWQAISLGLGETPTMIWRMSRPYLPTASIALFVITICYGVLFKVVQRPALINRFRAGPLFTWGTAWFFLSFVMLAVAGRCLVERDKVEPQGVFLLAETSPWLRGASVPMMDKQTFDKTARELGMTELIEPSRNGAKAEAARDWNVVLVFQESTYNKYLSLFNGTNDTQPLLSKYKDRMEVFPKFFSNFAGSINARFATFAGLYPVEDYKSFTLHRVETQSLFEILSEQGYQNSIFYSSSFDYTGFRDFLRGRKIHEMYDADSLPGQRKTPAVSWGVREEETLEAMQEQIKRYAATKQKFFMTYIPAAPHYPFDGVPPRFNKYSVDKIGDFTARYLNELLFMDWIIASIVDQLKDSGVLDKTLVVITSDHGELLGEDGGPIGHGWAVTPELANIPLIVMIPGRQTYQVNGGIGSQVDILPTILDLLNVPLPSQQFCQGASLYSTHLESNRTIYLNSFKQYGIIQGTNILCGERSRSSYRTFAIQNNESRTMFAEVTNTSSSLDVISKFDRFQQSLLAHHSQYREQAGKVKP